MAASIAQHGPFLAPTGTKLARQHPTSTPTGIKLARQTQNRQYLAFLDMQGELSLAPAATPPSRANFLSHQTPLDTTHPFSQPQPAQNSPSNTPPAPQPVQNSPRTHKIGNIWPFWTCRANFLSLIHHLGDNFHAADRHRLTVVHHYAHVAFCFFGPISCTLKVASHGVPLQGAHTGLIRTNSVHPVSTIKFPHTTTHAQIPPPPIHRRDSKRKVMHRIIRRA